MKFWLGMALGSDCGDAGGERCWARHRAAPYVVDVLTGGKKMLLWPDKPGGGNGAPGAVGNEPIDRPLLYLYLPKGENATKTGVIVAPGGGYQHLSMEKEGEDVALWLNAHGVAAFVLVYRLGPTYHHPIEIGDAQRAIRTVRERAAEYGIASDHLRDVGVLGGWPSDGDGGYEV